MTAQTQNSFSEYRGMWLFTMFDLPTTDKEARNRYTRFRNLLLKEGFVMLQYSVYARYCPSEEASLTYRKHIRKAVPAEGHVRVLAITDHQYGKMESFYGKKSVPIEEPPEQMVLL